VAFWLGMMGWLAGREWWVRYGSPPTMLSAMDAAISAGGVVEVKWHIFGNGQLVGTARTNTQFHSQQSSYELHQQVNLDIEKVGHLPLFQFLGPLLSNLPIGELKIEAKTETNSFGDVNRFALKVDIPNPFRTPTAKGDAPKPIAKFILETRLK